MITEQKIKKPSKKQKSQIGKDFQRKNQNWVTPKSWFLIFLPNKLKKIFWGFRNFMIQRKINTKFIINL